MDTKVKLEDIAKGIVFNEIDQSEKKLLIPNTAKGIVFNEMVTNIAFTNWCKRKGICLEL